MDVYITHCCAKKNNAYRDLAKAITPQELYSASPTQRFMRRCVEMGVRWAIFSDKYGVWFPEVLHEWYEKDPRFVTPEEFQGLRQNFDDSLRDFTKISFYANPGRFHPLYKSLLAASELRSRIRVITHLADIGQAA